MIENWLGKLSAKQFFIILGSILATGVLLTILTIIVMIITNFNFLQWME
jgi:hypothetical protein